MNQILRQKLILIGILCGFTAGVSFAEEFQWAWEKDGSNLADTAAVAPDSGAAAGGEQFQWSWKGEKTPDDIVETDLKENGEKQTGGVPVRPDSVQTSAGSEEVLKENLELRQKIAALMKDEETAKRENARLAAEANALEQKVAQFAQVISDLKEQQNEPANPESLAEVEAKLEKAEKEKERLVSELNNARRMKDAAAGKPAEPSITVGVKPGSDLFAEKERENLLLKKKLVEMESERRAALAEKEKIARESATALAKSRTVTEKIEEYKNRLKDAEKREQQHKESIRQLLDKMPDLKKERDSLQVDVSEKGDLLAQRERELEVLKIELERREYRLEKAEKMNEILEQTREEVAKSNDREKRDMHFNMAVVYTKEGRFEDAEREYLKALRIDPSDPDVHYNLGILYDDELGNKRRASIHYKRYIMLKPFAPDIDQVKSWLADAEMQR